MGLSDRDYLRADGGGRGARGSRLAGPPAWRRWSANTWLIVACVAIWVVDGFLPQDLVVIDRTQVREIEGSIDPSAMLVTPPRQSSVPGRWERDLGVRGPDGGFILVAVEGLAPMHPIARWLHFSTQKGFLEVQFWRLVGFQFLHAHGTIFHILFNMLGLYFFGPMVEQYLGSKRYLAYYLLCGICGALAYTALNLAGHVFGAVPGLLPNSLLTPLVGASAGVFGVIMAGAFLAPRATVLFMFVIPMPLRVLAYGLVAVACLTLVTGGDNAGGEAGHLGGALAGWYFIRHPRHLHDFFDFLGRVDPTSHHYRKGRGGGRPAPRAGRPDRDAVDRVLDKIRAEGLHSLTAAEKELLRRASDEG